LRRRGRLHISSPAMTREKRSFQAEVSRLLDIVAHSLYSEKEIFLRELISNASDACDRMRYLALTKPELAGQDAQYRVVLTPDRDKKTLIVDDNGIGMGHDELVENLGTIARSGTASFLQNLTGDAKKDVSLIGQFGVGFYSAFMVAEEVEVISRRAGDEQAWRWVSDGRGEFTVESAEKAGRGTTIILHLKEGEGEFLEPHWLRNIVKTYSEHIPLPIMLAEGGKEEKLNEASALWTRPKSEVKPEQYKEFYHHVAHAFDEPWLTLHFRAEGVLEYTGLLFVPATKPFDLFDPQRKGRLKLYVRRVFISDEAEGLLPAWLRFLRGVVDSEDLPLNVSREMLQSNPMLAKMRAQIVKRVLGELEKKAKDSPDEFATFWDNFGAVLKEGIYEDPEHRDALLALARFRSTAGEKLVSLEEYLGRMKPGQDAIFYVTGDSVAQSARSPHLEGFRAKSVEVLYFTDPVDEFWSAAVSEWKGKKLKSVTRGGADLAKIEGGTKDDAAKDEDGKAPANVQSLLAIFKLALGEAVKDVRTTDRLTDSAVCLVADEGDVDIHLERLLRQHRQVDKLAKRILELNPKHPLVARLSALVGKDGTTEQLQDMAWLLLDQAKILQGETLEDPAAFAKRLSGALQRGLPA
jgi:molecular chaperone HtpG